MPWGAYGGVGTGTYSYSSANSVSWGTRSVSTVGWSDRSALTATYTTPSAMSAWIKTIPLGLYDGVGDVHFLYVASTPNPVIANSIIPIRAVSRATLT